MALLLLTVAMERNHLLSHVSFPSVSSGLFISASSAFVQNRHSHAQFLLRWLQARAVRSAFVWSGDQVRMLLCQHRVCLRRTLPAMPAAKFRYGYLNSTHTHKQIHSYRESHIYANTPTHTLKSRFIGPDYSHVDRLQRCSSLGTKHFSS